MYVREFHNVKLQKILICGSGIIQTINDSSYAKKIRIQYRLIVVVKK